MNYILILFLFFFHALHSSESNVQKIIYSPIEMRNLNPTLIPFLDITPYSPQTLDKKKMSITYNLAASNTIVDTNVLGDRESYSKLKPIFWDNSYKRLLKERYPYSSVVLFSEYSFYSSIPPFSKYRADVEVYHLNLRFSYGLFSNFEIGLQPNLFSYNKGSMDILINQYHNLIGIPYIERSVYPDNQFAFYITDNTKTVVKSKIGTGLGDSILDAKWKLYNGNYFLPSYSFVTIVKIPTGNRNLWMSSGKTDIGFGLAMQWTGQKFYSFLNLFYTKISNPFDSIEMKTKDMYSLSYTFGYIYSSRLSFLTQFDYKTSPYRSGIPLLNKSILLWSLGFSYSIGNETSLMLSFSEDLIIFSSPDFSFRFGVKHFL